MKKSIEFLSQSRLLPALVAVGFGVGAWLGISTSLQSPKSAAHLALQPEPVATAYEGSSISGYYLASRFAESQDHLRAAAENIGEVLDRNPDDLALQRAGLRTLVAAGEMEQAADVARRVLEAGTKDSLALIVGIVHEAKLGQYDRALALMDKPVTSHGMLEIIKPALRQWLLLAVRPHEGGVVNLDQALKKAGFMESFMHYQLGLMNDMVGEHQAAHAHYRQSISDPLAIPYRLVEALSNHHLRQGNKEAAQGVYDQYASQNPGSELIPDRVPQIDTEPMAVTPLVQAPVEGMAELLFTTASLLFGEDVTRESLIYLRLALYLRPDLPPAQLMLANILEQMKDHEGAMAVYQSIDPATVFYRRGQVRLALNLEAAGQKGRAIDLLERHARAHPQDIEALIALGDIYRSDKDYQAAITQYNRAMQRIETLRADHWTLLYARGIAYERAGEWARAEADLKRALELEPQQPDVLNYLGYSWLVQGKHVEQARDYIEQAVEQRPNDAHIIDSMGWVHYLMGDFERAVDYLEQAAELTPQDATINEHLGDAYWRTGRKIEAEFQWKRALQFGPEDAKSVERKLEAGLPDFTPVVRQAGRTPQAEPVASAPPLEERASTLE